jgi:hypothetical protein
MIVVAFRFAQVEALRRSAGSEGPLIEAEFIDLLSRRSSQRYLQLLKELQLRSGQVWRYLY